jgi:hypothetical protein
MLRCLRIWLGDRRLGKPLEPLFASPRDWDMKKRASVLDTDPETERVLIELTRAMPDWKKLRQIAALSEGCRRLTLAGLRDRYPNASAEELRKRFAALVLDRETVIKMFEWDPEVEGY